MKTLTSILLMSSLISFSAFAKKDGSLSQETSAQTALDCVPVADKEEVEVGLRLKLEKNIDLKIEGGHPSPQPIVRGTIGRINPTIWYEVGLYLNMRVEEDSILRVPSDTILEVIGVVDGVLFLRSQNAEYKIHCESNCTIAHLKAFADTSDYIEFADKDGTQPLHCRELPIIKGDLEDESQHENVVL